MFLSIFPNQNLNCSVPLLPICKIGLMFAFSRAPTTEICILPIEACLMVPVSAVTWSDKAEVALKLFLGPVTFHMCRSHVPKPDGLSVAFVSLTVTK